MPAAGGTKGLAVKPDQRKELNAMPKRMGDTLLALAVGT
jgi:hypothetical protein